MLPFTNKQLYNSLYNNTIYFNKTIFLSFISVPK